MDVVHKNHSRFRRPKRELALDARSFQAWHTFFEQEPANFALVILGPDEEKVCDGGVGDPVFSAADPPAPVLLPPRPRLHGAWVRPVVWLREAEATHHPACPTETERRKEKRGTAHAQLFDFSSTLEWTNGPAAPEEGHKIHARETCKRGKDKIYQMRALEDICFSARPSQT